jgi:hypothetical protein
MDVNYYLVEVPNPKRLQPYTMEVEDIIEALDMTFAEGNILKALVRSCVARKCGVIKARYDGIEYDSEKIVYYGQRRLAQVRRTNHQPPKEEAMHQTKEVIHARIPGAGIPADAVITFDDYQRNACRTAPTEDVLLSMNHVSLGLATEIGETAKVWASAVAGDAATIKDAIEELNDTAWYVAYGAAMLDEHLSGICLDLLPDDFQYKIAAVHRPEPTSIILNLMAHAGDFVTEVKRAVVYKKPLDEDRKKHMVRALTMVMQDIAAAHTVLGVKFSKGLQQNIDKLRIRFPDKFSAEAAEARADKGGVDARHS